MTSMFWAIVTQTDLNPGRTFKLFSYRNIDNRWNHWFITPGSPYVSSACYSQPHILMMINLACTQWLTLVIFEEISKLLCQIQQQHQPCFWSASPQRCSTKCCTFVNQSPWERWINWFSIKALQWMPGRPRNCGLQVQQLRFALCNFCAVYHLSWGKSVSWLMEHPMFLKHSVVAATKTSWRLSVGRLLQACYTLRWLQTFRRSG